jgi:hypothetical protein
VQPGASSANASSGEGALTITPPRPTATKSVVEVLDVRCPADMSMQSSLYDAKENRVPILVATVPGSPRPVGPTVLKYNLMSPVPMHATTSIMPGRVGRGQGRRHPSPGKAVAFVTLALAGALKRTTLPHARRVCHRLCPSQKQPETSPPPSPSLLASTTTVAVAIVGSSRTREWMNALPLPRYTWKKPGR